MARVIVTLVAITLEARFVRHTFLLLFHYCPSGTREDDLFLFSLLAIGVVLLMPPTQFQVTVPGVAVMK